MLQAELMAKGVPADTARSVIATYDEEAACRDAAAKKPSLDRAGLTKFLLGRGFRYDVVKVVVADVGDALVE